MVVVQLIYRLVRAKISTIIFKFRDLSGPNWGPRFKHSDFTQIEMKNSTKGHLEFQNGSNLELMWSMILS